MKSGELLKAIDIIKRLDEKIEHMDRYDPVVGAEGHFLGTDCYLNGEYFVVEEVKEMILQIKKELGLQ